MTERNAGQQGDPWFTKHVLDRRRFLGVAAGAGAGFLLNACGGGDGGGSSTTAGESTGTVSGATPAERAINGIKSLNLPADFEITVFSEDLSIQAAVVTKDAFESASGIKLDIQEAPYLEYAAKVLNDATRKAGTYDCVLMETNRMGDLGNAGYLADLSGWVEKYNPQLDTMIAPQAQVWAKYNGKYVGLPTDGDVFMFYYRKDLLEDPAEQKAFEERFGRELEVPKTYDEYNEVLEFFTRPDDKLYGAVEWRIKGVTYDWFHQRLWSAGGTYFKDDMSAAINSAEGVKALEDMKAMNKFMPPDVLSYGYAETVEAMANGTTFSNITWPAAGKNVSDPKTSKTVGKWGFATVPGYVVDGEPNPKSMSAPGYNFIVSEFSEKNKEAVYLYGQWLVDPQNLTTIAGNPKGNSDAIRQETFDSPQMAEIFPGADEYLKAQLANLEQAVPDPILPGYAEYTQALEIEISNFMSGKGSAQDALNSAASKWDEITEGFGRDQQAEIWKNFLESYGA
jgi:multiple sugar transport system substrate-binding protein